MQTSLENGFEQKRPPCHIFGILTSISRTSEVLGFDRIEHLPIDSKVHNRIRLMPELRATWSLIDVLIISLFVRVFTKSQ